MHMRSDTKARHLDNMADRRRTRSLRRDGIKKRNPPEFAKEFIHRPDDPPGFRIEKFKNKGRGVVTEVQRKKSDFLLVYRGEKISAKEGGIREEKRSSGYRFFFHSGGKRLCIDATKENKTLGRLVNHGERKERNCSMKECSGSLCLFAMRDIEEEEELLYDYGLKKLPWQQSTSKDAFPGPSLRECNVSTSRSEPGQIWGHVIVMKDGCELNAYPMDSTILAIGSMPSNCIIVKEAAAHEAILEVSKSCEVFLVRRKEEGNAEVHCLKDDDLFTVGKRTFKWKYMNQSQKDNMLEDSSIDSISKVIENETENDLELESSKQTSNDTEDMTINDCELESSNHTSNAPEDMTINDCELESSHHTSNGPEDMTINDCELESSNHTSNGPEDMTINDCELESSKQTSNGPEDMTINDCELESSHHTSNGPEDMTINDCELESSKQTSNDPEDMTVNNCELESSKQTSNGPEDLTIINCELESSKQTSNDHEDVESSKQTTIAIEDGTENNLELESGKQTSNDPEDVTINDLELEPNKQTSNDHEDFTSDWFPESDQETMDDSVNDPDYVVEKGYSDSNEDNDYDLSNHENDFVPDSSSDVSDTIPPITSLPALERKHTSLDDSKEKPQKRKKRRENTGNHSLSSASANVTVQATNNAVGRRKWDKTEYCLYCSKGSTNVTKHFLKSHKAETDIKQILDLSKGSKERSQEILRVRRAGNYQHNCSVLKEGMGEIVVVARPNVETKPEDYLPCECCLGFFLRDSLWRHKQVCPFVGTGRKSRNVQAEAYLLLPSSVDIHEGLKSNVFSKMASDEVTIAARGDKIIVKIGEKLYQKHGHLPHLRNHVSQKMRELGRFLICAREQDSNIIRISDILVPEKFPLAVKSAKILCKFNEIENSFGNPSLALKLGHILKKCAKLLKCEALINADMELGKKADGFLTLCEQEWTDEISSCALSTLTTAKMNKGQTLPLSEDIVKLQQYFDKRKRTLTETLTKQFVKSDWEMLNMMTLAELVLFNRRRGGETQRMRVQAYVSRMKNPECPPQEVMDSLSTTEKCLLKTLSRVEIRGKKGRTVPVLIPNKLQRNIDLLIQQRQEAGVAKENEYVFPRPNFGSVEPLRSSDVLRYFANEAGLSNPKHITSTKLRKHVATVAQVLKLDQNDLETMASFMGHDINVHRSFYRLPQEVLQVARMGRLLTAFNNGTVGQYSGKSIDDISLEEDNELSSDDSGGEHDDECDDDAVQDQDNSTDDVFLGPSSKVKEASSSRKKTAPKIDLTDEQRQLLSRLFKTNVTMRRELKKIDCLNASTKYKCLQVLPWKKIKNTVHNWITVEKRKIKHL